MRRASPRKSRSKAADGRFARVAAPAHPSMLTAGRRWVFASAVLSTMSLLMLLMAKTLSPGGLDLLDKALLLCFGFTLPWTVIGFWNAVIGLLLMRFSRDPVARVFPLGQGERVPVNQKVAILSCIRNEDAETVYRNLDRMVAGLAEKGVTDRFAVHVLSDSTWAECISDEEGLSEGFGARWGQSLPVSYRRREDNPGFKAGNIAEFMDRCGERYDLALVLDADSVMDPHTVLAMVRTMQANPRLGILQSLVVGLPSVSAFARAFQFGMRFGMRSYTLGSAWWQGDCGPYWGHNALLRVRPFMEHCRIPRISGRGPLSGWVLSHDQVEAVLMRRAGYEVRVLPQETGSYEENPTTLLEYIRRDLRWCQGNLQYFRFLGTRGLHALSRVQLILAILMFISSPFWVSLMVIAASRAFIAPAGPLFDPSYGMALLFIILTMVFAPKLASVIDLLADARRRGAFGGASRVIAGALGEAFFSTLLAPVLAIAHSVFIGGLLAGKKLAWEPQRRLTHRVPIALAWRRLWPQTLIGIAVTLALATHGSVTIALLSPFFIGALVAVPIAVWSADPRLGLWVTRHGFWAIPEELAPSPFLASLNLDALNHDSESRGQVLG
ncbi:glucans biosynthesis glucosyltransferase MdoH [Thiorhodovibrio winogradskyi]|uniref:glucans biosynthesis glucosyltransferase MdoH n=2 Tax=Thiorhodovibrio TaxID=61593 RepID=UPI00237C306F|nr:glucans biosynthesis glucosyltransferase MdoH [Thiorhodovibrio winogradskyi]